MKTNKIIAAVIIFLLPAAVWAGTYSGGDGVTTPYQISTVADWLELIDTSNDYDSNFVLINDLDLQGVALRPVAEGSSFTGVFDGDGYVIRNVVINQPENNYVGLFRCVNSPGEIYDLGVEDVNIIGKSHVGGVVGYNGNNIDEVGGAITNCYVTGNLKGSQHVGGVAGINYGGIFDCNFTGDVSGRHCVGGVVGFLYGTVSNCFSSGSVNGGNYSGGLVGSNRAEAKVLDCSSTSDVNGGRSVGGLVGRNRGNVLNSYSTGSVSGTGESVGGLVGGNYFDMVSTSKAFVSNCYSTGNVTGGRSVGGLVGGNFWGSISDCYATGDVSGQDYVGGLMGIGGNVSNSYATGNVSGTGDFVGGLAGDYDGNVSNCYATGDVNGVENVGGLVGENDTGTITECYSTGDVNGDGRGVGGLVGKNYVSVSNCYSTGDVNGRTDVGGLVGYNSGSISNCYSTGSVSGFYRVGGLIGYNRSNVSNCFWDIDTQTHGVTDSFGYNGGTVVNVAGLATSEMMQEVTFTSAGWDFVTPVWTIDEGLDYPRLWWEYVSPLELLDILYQDVIDLELHHGIENSLLAKLDAALKKLEDDNENNDGAAVNLLEAFINAVEAQYGKKIPQADADALIDAVWQIIDLLSSE